jgi:hypothetical protein
MEITTADRKRAFADGDKRIMTREEREANEDFDLRRTSMDRAAETGEEMALHMVDLGEFKLSRALEFIGEKDGLKYTAPDGFYPVFAAVDADGQVRHAGVVFDGVNENGERLNTVRVYDPQQTLELVNAREIALTRTDEHELKFPRRDVDEQKQEQKRTIDPDGDRKHKHRMAIGA